MGYALDFGWLNGAIGMIASGAAMTIFLIAVTTVAGVILSIFGAAAKRSRYPVLRKAIGAYVELIRNTPFLVQLFFIFFGLAVTYVTGGNDNTRQSSAVQRIHPGAER